MLPVGRPPRARPPAASDRARAVGLVDQAHTVAVPRAGSGTLLLGCLDDEMGHHRRGCRAHPWRRPTNRRQPSPVQPAQCHRYGLSGGPLCLVQQSFRGQVLRDALSESLECVEDRRPDLIVALGAERGFERGYSRAVAQAAGTQLPKEDQQPDGDDGRRVRRPRRRQHLGEKGAMRTPGVPARQRVVTGEGGEELLGLVLRQRWMQVWPTRGGLLLGFSKEDGVGSLDIGAQARPQLRQLGALSPAPDQVLDSGIPGGVSEGEAGVE